MKKIIIISLIIIILLLSGCSIIEYEDMQNCKLIMDKLTGNKTINEIYITQDNYCCIKIKNSSKNFCEDIEVINYLVNQIELNQKAEKFKNERKTD